MQPWHRPGRFVSVMSSYSPSQASGCAIPLFEAWLQSGLQRLYDRALYEPLPDELLRLIPQSQETGSKQS
jgi:hypothetical protein